MPAATVATRRQYRPLAHPGRRGSWSREAIVAALQSWTALTGHAPRRQDWSGERRARASDAQRRWMHEHPRWPSSSCVARQFGSWSAALDAAGLSARRLTFATTLADRVATAAALAATGVGTSEIAARLGVSRATVHNYLRARSCPSCGGPLPTPVAQACRECTRHEPTIARSWTHAEALAAIRDWTAEHGAAPTYRDWTPKRDQPGRWEAESPRWPSAASVCAHYADGPEPWNAALRDAGAAPRTRRWSDAAIRSELTAFWVREGRPPAAQDLRAAAGWTGPSRETLTRRFGSVEQAWSTLAPIPAPGASPQHRDRTHLATHA